MKIFLDLQTKLCFFAITIITFSLFNAPSASAIDCPENWKIPATTSISKVVDDVSQINEITEILSENALSDLKSGLRIGNKYLVIYDYNFPIPDAYVEKIGPNNPDVVLQGSWKVSADLKNWKGLSLVHPGSLTSNNEIYLASIPPKNIDKTALIKSIGSARAFPLTHASRSGIVSGAYLAMELVINVKGCKPFRVFERLTKIPFYKIDTENLDSVITKYYLEFPEKAQINFLSRTSCLKTLETLIQHLKNVTAKDSNWSISNTNRGVLDLAWSLNGRENTTCYDGAASSSFPFFDLTLNPSIGDGCITRKDPYKSTFSYKTLQTPCMVSLDSNGFEVSRFVIVKPMIKVPNVPKITTIICIKGKLTKQVSAIRPQCPSGFKKK